MEWNKLSHRGRPFWPRSTPTLFAAIDARGWSFWFVVASTSFVRWPNHAYAGQEKSHLCMERTEPKKKKLYRRHESFRFDREICLLLNKIRDREQHIHASHTHKIWEYFLTSSGIAYHAKERCLFVSANGGEGNEAAADGDWQTVSFWNWGRHFIFVHAYCAHTETKVPEKVMRTA